MLERIQPREKGLDVYMEIGPHACKPLIWWAQRILVHTTDVIFRTPVTALAFSLQIEHLPVGLRHHGLLV